MRFLGRRDNPNAVAGLFLLILLMVLAGPSAFPRLVENFEFADEGVPCRWLREGEDRAFHQSLISRAISLGSDPPISLHVETSAISTDPNTQFIVAITVVNNTVGPVPFIIPIDDTVVVGTGTGENGLGIVFNATQAIPQSNQVGTYAEEQIHILGPRQRCVHRVSFPINQILQIDQSIGIGSGQIRAFYRNSSRGGIGATGNPNQAYSDQGLWIGIIESDPFAIAISTQ